MKVIYSVDNMEKPIKNAVVSIGNFDGVHMGHQALFRKVREKAAAINGTSVAITFKPHPNKVLNRKSPPLITIFEQKVELIEKNGIDVLVCIPFTKEFSMVPARDFITNVLVKTIGMKAIVVGRDYAFGKNREGNIDFLKELSLEHEFETICVDWIEKPDIISGRISSTKIRQLVMDGEVAKAAFPLSRYYQIRGIVEKGRDRGGKLLGFPTANIKLSDELCPKQGVYAVTVECLGETSNAVANIGYSPTFDDMIFTIEAHILDFDKNIYDEEIRVNFVKRLRSEKKFSGIEELSKQINKDIKKARVILAEL